MPNSTLNHDRSPDVRLAVEITSSNVRTAASATCGVIWPSVARIWPGQGRRIALCADDVAHVGTRPLANGKYNSGSGAISGRRDRTFATTPMISVACPVGANLLSEDRRRIQVGKEPPRQGLVDDGDGRRALAIALVKRAAGDDRHAHGLEIPVHHDAVLGDRHPFVVVGLIHPAHRPVEPGGGDRAAC